MKASSWREDALCRGTESVFFLGFESSGRSGRPPTVPNDYVQFAKYICSLCPVKKQCLDYALGLPQGQQFGIWGGKTARERKKIKKK